jgi:hypothetical protein
VLAQAVFRLELPAEVAARALGEEGVFAVQLDARLVGAGPLAPAVDAHVAGGDALHPPGVEQHLVRGESGKDLDAERLGLRAEPAAEVAQADDVVAVVAETGGKEKIRGFDR